MKKYKLWKNNVDFISKTFIFNKLHRTVFLKFSLNTEIGTKIRYLNDLLKSQESLK